MSQRLKGWALESRSIGMAADRGELGFVNPTSSMFGTLGSNKMFQSTTADFIPVDGAGGVVNVKGINVNPQWMGLDSVNMQHLAYVLCSPLASVIDKLAEADTNGVVRFVAEDDETLKPLENIARVPHLKRIRNLLKKPNPLQTWQEFNSEQIVLCKKYGYCPVYAVCPSGFDKTHTVALFNLNPYFFKPKSDDNFRLFSVEEGEVKSPIKSWYVSLFGEEINIPNEEVFIIKDGFIATVDKFGLPISKIAGLDFFISNICAAMEADNVLLKKKGPLGIFSHDPRPDIAGWQPMTPDEKGEVQNELSRYGLTLGQMQYIISRTPIKWNAMSFNVRDLMTKETIRQAIDGICDRFGFPAELMSGKNATYENRSSAEKFLYQNNIIPFSLRRMSSYTEFFGLDDYDVKIILSYNHLPVLQEDIEKNARAVKADTEGSSIAWKDGMITRNEYRKKINQPEEAADGDLYYPDWMAKHGSKINQNDNQSNTGADNKAKEESSSD